MGMVIAARENARLGAFIGFQVDSEILECSECTTDAAYRLRYTEDERRNLAEHRFSAHKMIEREHPKHSDQIRVG